MRKIGILVGEDADLPKNLIKSQLIEIFPFVVEWEGYKAMRENNEAVARTSQPSAQTLKKVLEENAKKYYSILVFTVSSSFSGTYNSAIQAKNLLPVDVQKRIYVIDSRTSTGSEALIVLKTLELIKNNTRESVENVAKKANGFIVNSHLLGVFDDPSWLKRGGRISSVQALVVKNILKAGLRPILTVKDGKIVTKKIQMNAKNKAIALFAQFREEIKDFAGEKQISVAVTHGDCLKEANSLKELVQNFDKNIKIEFVNTVSPVVGAHLGPDSLILSYIINN